MEAIDVSPEMLTLVGSGAMGDHRWPTTPVAFEFRFEQPATVRFHAKPTKAALRDNQADVRLVLIVARDACERVFGGPLRFEDSASYLLTPDLRFIAQAIRDCRLPEAAGTPYRLAKSIELLCEILIAHRQDRLTPAPGTGNLSHLDLQRIGAARQLIEERWNAKLTLDQIARHCGLNRSKLSRGFREIYDCSVSEALAERRLAEARRQLIATDLPVSQIGYRSGYLNNAAFTRAFGRRFGQSPSNFRACAVVAP